MTHAQLVQKAVHGCAPTAAEWFSPSRLAPVAKCPMPSDGSAPATLCWSNARSRAPIFSPIAKSPSARNRNSGWAVNASISHRLACFVQRNCPPDGDCSNCRNRKIKLLQPAAKNLRTATGFRYEMNLLLASLRRVEIRIEPRNLTDFLKWKNRMAEYNRGACQKASCPPKKNPTSSWKPSRPN